MGYKVEKGDMPFASQKISISIRETSGTGIICLFMALLLTTAWLKPAKSQEPIVIGSSQPQIQVNEEAAYVRAYPEMTIGSRLPLFDPAKDTLKSRVIYLPQTISRIPNPQVAPTANGEKELAAIPPNPPDAIDRSGSSNTKSIFTDPLTIIFGDGEKDIRADETERLAAFANELVANDSTRLQLRSYASDVNESASAARRLSLARALAVRSFLIEAGVNSTRIDVRALGAKNERGPADRVDLVVAN